MKIYKDKNGTIYIVVGKDEKEPSVCIAQDCGNKEIRNFFGDSLERFAYHYASLWKNTPYTSRTSCLIDEEDEAYQYKLVKTKKVKRLGKRKSK